MAELQRAEKLMGVDFVTRTKEKFRAMALERIAAEKEVGKLLRPILAPSLIFVL